MCISFNYYPYFINRVILAGKNYKFLTGNSGQIYFWSALTLHGTQSQTSEKPRISLRYLIERSKDEGKFLIDMDPLELQNGI